MEVVHQCRMRELSSAAVSVHSMGQGERTVTVWRLGTSFRRFASSYVLWLCAMVMDFAPLYTERLAVGKTSFSEADMDE